MKNKHIGWVCPKCDKVNAPHVNACDCVPVQKVTVIPYMYPLIYPWNYYPELTPYRPYITTPGVWITTSTSDSTQQASASYDWDASKANVDADTYIISVTS